MFLGSLMAAALLMPVGDNSDSGATQAKIDAAKEAYRVCIVAGAAQMYHGADNKRLEKKIGEFCNGAFDGWLDAMSSDDIPEMRAAAKDAMQPILREAIHLAVQAEAEARRSGRRISAS